MVCEGKCSPLIDALADELLQDLRMAGLVKLHRGMGTVGRGRLWAVLDGRQFGPFVANAALCTF